MQWLRSTSSIRCSIMHWYYCWFYYRRHPRHHYTYLLNGAYLLNIILYEIYFNGSATFCVSAIPALHDPNAIPEPILFVYPQNYLCLSVAVPMQRYLDKVNQLCRVIHNNNTSNQVSSTIRIITCMQRHGSADLLIGGVICWYSGWICPWRVKLQADLEPFE